MTKPNARLATARRAAAVALFLLAAFCFLTARLFVIQVFGFDRYQKKVIEQITTASPVPAARGAILDANGVVLATDRTVYRISVFPSAVAGQDAEGALSRAIAEGLAAAVPDLSADKVLRDLSHNRELERTTVRETDKESADRVVAAILQNGWQAFVAVEAVTARYYPQGTLAAHVLGFTGSDGQGLYGLELQYDEQLSGQAGAYVTARDSTGNELPDRYSAYTPATPGMTLSTTIDVYVQAALEEQLETARIAAGAQNRVCGVVMNVKTGAILGMATSPSFDPNEPFLLNAESLQKLNDSGYLPGSDEYKTEKQRLLAETWNNKAVTEIYMPGSTFKTMTCSMVLEEGAVTDLNEAFYCRGSLTVADRIIHCHKREGHGAITFAEGLQKSCNPVMMTISARIGCDVFYEYVKNFGMLEKTGVDLPGEGRSIFHAQNSFTELDLATASFGQNFKVSVLQMITAVSAVANGGKLVTPYLVERVTDVAGQTVYQHETTVRRQVVSEQTAKTVSTILAEGVAGEGGAKNAYVAGFRVAAKTGTSEKIGDDREARIGSCVGFAPADDPEIAVIIVVDEPTCYVKYGSVVAAPYVAGVFRSVLPHLGVEPVYTEAEQEARTLTVPDLCGLSMTEAAKLLGASGFTVRFAGNSGQVTGQTPSPGTVVKRDGATVTLCLGEASERTVTVPDVVQKDLGDAGGILTGVGLNIGFCRGDGWLSGDRTVVAQTPAAGQQVPLGTVVMLQFPYDESEE